MKKFNAAEALKQLEAPMLNAIAKAPKQKKQKSERTLTREELKSAEKIVKNSKLSPKAKEKAYRALTAHHLLAMDLDKAHELLRDAEEDFCDSRTGMLPKDLYLVYARLEDYPLEIMSECLKLIRKHKPRAK